MTLVGAVLGILTQKYIANALNVVLGKNLRFNMIYKRKKGIGAESKIHKDFASLIKQYQGYKKLKAHWWSYDASGEKRNAITGALLKAKGLNAGKPDYEFIMVKTSPNNKNLCLAHYIYIEFKKPKDINSPAGTQSDNQKKFENIFKDAINAHYYICYSVKEAIDILINHEFLEV